MKVAQIEGYTPFRTPPQTINMQTMALSDLTLANFDAPQETRSFPKGKFELLKVGGMTIGRATYQPGWKWSVDVGPSVSALYCAVEHVGFVVSGRAVAAMNDGRMIEMKAGDVFYIPPGHDSWVVGDEPYVSIHLMGAESYARHGEE